MASGWTLHLSSAAQKFIDEHTVVDIAADGSEECPVCRDEYDYSLELRVRIAGIPVCSHTFGMSFLEQYLATDPQTLKTCATCRTEWVLGPRRRRYHW